MLKSKRFWMFAMLAMAAGWVGAQGPPPVPTPPTNVQASDGTFADRVQVTWTAADGALSYDVLRHTANSIFDAGVIATGVVGTAYADTTAAAGLTNYYWVRTLTAYGLSGWSAPDTGFRTGNAGAVRFKSTLLRTAEGVTLKIKVVRAGGADGAASVGYKTVSKTARAGQDFVARQGRLTWADGDGTVKKIKVKILADGLAEPTEKFKVKLFGVQGMAMSLQRIATVVIPANGAGGAPAGATVAWHEAVTEGPGVLAFEWRVESDAPRDTLVFLANGAGLARREGAADWERLAFAFGPGVFTNRWVFIGDPDVPTGAGRLRSITWESGDGL